MAAWKHLTLEERRENRLRYKREYYRKWRIENREKVNKAAADWRVRNLERSKEVSNSWKRKNPAKHAAHTMQRKAAKLQRTPAWADTDEIQKFYDEARRISKETGLLHHVDHIVPLQGKNVSGLHVQNNLQVLGAKDNMLKGNRFHGD